MGWEKERPNKFKICKLAISAYSLFITDCGKLSLSTAIPLPFHNIPPTGIFQMGITCFFVDNKNTSVCLFKRSEVFFRINFKG